MPKKAISHASLDKAGMTASTACAVHCALMPIVVSFLPLLGLGWLSSEWVEWTLLLASACMGATSLCWGVKKHGNRCVLGWLGAAITMLVLARITEEHNWRYGWIVAVAGGLTMAGAHLWNHRLCRSCHTCSADHH